MYFRLFLLLKVLIDRSANVHSETFPSTSYLYRPTVFIDLEEFSGFRRFSACQAMTTGILGP